MTGRHMTTSQSGLMCRPILCANLKPFDVNFYINVAKFNFAPVYDMKVCGGLEVYFLSFLT